MDGKSKLKIIKEYRDSPALNQSFLKTLLLPNPKFIVKKKEKEKYYKENPYFLKGNLIDVLLTVSEHFNDIFYLNKLEKKPSPATLSICKYVYDNYNFERLEEEGIPRLKDIPDLILEGIKKDNYYSTWKDETRISKVVMEGSDYFQMLIEAEGKQVITTEEYHLANRQVTGLLTHNHTKDFFYRKYETQVPLYWKMEGENCKGLLDFLIEENQIVDIKSTTEYYSAIPSIIKKYRLDFQLAFYYLGLKELTGQEELPLPILIFSSTTDPENPQVWQISKKDLNIAINGLIKFKKDMIYPDDAGNERYIKNPVLGIKQAFLRYWYYQEFGYDKPYDLQEINVTDLW